MAFLVAVAIYLLTMLGMAKSKLPADEQARLPKRLWSIDEAAHLLGVERTHIYRLVDRGELKLLKQGRRSFISDRDLAAYIAKLEADAN